MSVWTVAGAYAGLLVFVVWPFCKAASRRDEP